MAVDGEIKSAQFRRERAPTWRELDRIVGRVEKGSLASLTSKELERLPVLYRSVASSLSLARSVTLDRALLEYLESLTARAYFCVYSSKRRLRDTVRHFLLRAFPRAVRELRWHLALSFSFFALGSVASYMLVLDDPGHFYQFVDEAYAQGRNPAASTESLRDVLYSGSDEEGGSLAAFASYLFSNNTRVGLLCFALGFAVGVPVFLLLFKNGLILGSFVAIYADRDLGPEMWAWLLPHGVTEILALLLGGASGLAIAEAVVFPGRHSRRANLALAGRRTGIVMLGTVVMLLIAALIEGFFRQLVQDMGVRYLVAASTGAFWLAYLIGAGRGQEPSS